MRRFWPFFTWDSFSPFQPTPDALVDGNLVLDANGKISTAPSALPDHHGARGGLKIEH
jgi:hypothetical protein